jgi:hypothetical protein
MPHISSEDAYPFISALHSDIEDAHLWIESQKKENGDQFYNLTMARIKSEADVPMPKDMPSGKYIGANIFSHIKKTSVFKSIYTVDVLGKKVTIHMTFEKKELSKKWKEPNIQLINTQIDNIITWLHVASKYTAKKCAAELDVFIYLTSLEKKIPDLDEEIISAGHVNTGVTMSCPLSHGEIIVYRHEEWFKVFIHESFHTLGLDFSSMMVDKSETKLRETFHIPTSILLFEAYTEFWARVMNVLLFSFKLTISNKSDFEKYAIFMLDYERVNSFFQMAKVLQHMKIEYQDLYTDATLLERYRENTNVFVYYVITSILMSNYPSFLNWCNQHNSKLLQFEQTEDNQLALCNYIQNHYNTSDMTGCILHAKRLLTKIKANSAKYSDNKNIKFILETLRMSLHETCIR